jgi:hypothetical protein
MHAVSRIRLSTRSGGDARLARRLIVMAISVPVFLSACATGSPVAPGSGPASVAPPVHASEGVVARETSLGRAAAELVADAVEILPTGRVVLRVENRGDSTFTYGRPIVVERWNGQAWVETVESREAAWTMELLIVRARETGVEQQWPFLPTHRPEPGWYRFTKSVQTENPPGDPEAMVVRARVRVIEG